MIRIVSSLSVFSKSFAKCPFRFTNILFVANVTNSILVKRNGQMKQTVYW